MTDGSSIQPDRGEGKRSPAALIAAARQEAEAAEAAGGGGGPGERTSSAVWAAGVETAAASGGGLAAASGGGPAPDSFAGYRILREVHRGGQGVVYQAIQKSTKRKVALKVMKEGPFASPGERARFEREVEILGQLSHPNIVAIHDSGQAGGCQYFVMDYIGGQPLDVYMASGARPIDNSLRLFAKICGAVNAAHLRGITHRDLKPGNIRIDDSGEPHVLDFGLAKLATGSDSTAMTVTGQFVGSLPWASPEQAEGTPGKIDLRTDVYSLGVILYQMLTGHFPYEVVGNMHDVLDRIMRAAPARPSTIRRQINDEVETIALKCLAKERERRYQSAGELARDVGHYLAGEPIEAKRDSAAYVLGKYLKKYRVRAGVAAAFLLVIVVGLAGSLTFWREAAVARGRAEQASRVADERRAAAEASEARAVEEAERADRAAAAAGKQAAIAESVNRLMNDMLARANPVAEKGNPNVTVREVMDIAARELDSGTAKYEPEVEAALRLTLGQTYRALGLHDEAEKHLRAALAQREALFGRESLGVAEVLENLSLLLVDKGANHQAEAEPLAGEALAIRRRLLGSDHPAVADALNTLGITLRDVDRAEEAFSEALAVRRRLFGDEDVAVAETLSRLAWLAGLRGEWDAAEAQSRDVLAVRRRVLGEDHPDIAASLNQIGDILAYGGDLAAAEPFFRDALAIYRRLLGDEHPLVAAAAGNLGIILDMLGDKAGAESLLREALEIHRKLAKDDVQLAYVARNLGVLLHDAGGYDEAEPLFREALVMYDRAGYNSADDCVARIGLGSSLAHLDRFAEGEPILVDAGGRLAALEHQEEPNAAVRASASITRLRRRAFNCLVELYERWQAAEPDAGHDRQAADARARLAEWQATTQPAD